MPTLKPLILLAALATTASGPDVPDEAAVLRELNALRAAPVSYAAELRRIATGYDGLYYREGGGTEHGSREGTVAVAEAADALVRQPPVPPLAGDRTLRQAARDQVEAQGPAGAIGHASDAGANAGERVRRRGGDIYVGETISYGMHGAADVIRSLVVDDGVSGRGHRRLLLSPAYRYAGIWCGPHAVWQTMCVLVLAGSPGGRPVVPAR